MSTLRLVFLIATVVMCSLCTDGTKAMKVAQRELPAEVRLANYMAPGSDPSKTCSGLWNQEGFVCKKDSLLALSTRDAESVSASIKQFNEFIPGLRAFILDLRPVYTSSTLDALYVMTANFNPQDTARCWNTLARMRNSALCSVCSGINYKFFQKDRAGISENSCSKFIADCKDHFRFVFNSASLGEMAQYFIISEIKYNAEAVKSLLKATSQNFFNNAASIQADIKNLTALNFEIVLSKTEAEKKLLEFKFCESVVNLIATPFIFGLNKKFVEWLGVMKTIGVHLKKHSRALSSQISPIANWRSRQLQLGQTSQFNNFLGFLTGDVVVLHQSEVAVGAYHSDLIRPMNLSLTFP